MTAQAGLSSTNLITPLLNTLRGAPFSVSSLYAELHTAIPGTAGTTAVSAAAAARSPLVFAAAASNAINSYGNPPIWMNSGYTGEVISYIDVWNQGEAGTFNNNGTFYLSAPLTSTVTWDANDTLALSSLAVSLGPVATADADGFSAKLIAAWLNTFTGIGGTKFSTAKVYAQLHTGKPGVTGATDVSVGCTTRKQVTFSAAANNSIAMSGAPADFTNSGTEESVTDLGFFSTETGDNVAAPSDVAVTGATTGGNLPAGATYWVATAVNFAGETVASSEVTATLTGSTSSATLTWTLPDGATGINIYRGPTGAENVLVASLGAVTTYTDTGTSVKAATPPGSNTAATYLFSTPLPESISWATSGDTITLATLSITLSPAASSS